AVVVTVRATVAVTTVDLAGGSSDGFEAVASASEPDSSMFGAFKPRDPEAVRASTSNLFGGVHAGRSHARETRGTDSE
ncbi:hypothetical protein, partial [Mycobacterium sp. E802]|uniref:hypothetical protein n=1 Tax=Mycobacterium sp. E802 TaxID=1834152 RepID=UPI000AE4034F